MIKRFKGIDEANSAIQGRLIDNDSITLDSSVFVIEAALNYDFSVFSGDREYEMQEDVVFEMSPIGISGENIGSEDLEDIYEDLTDSITSVITPEVKVRVVDIEAISYNQNQIIFKAVIKRHIKYIRQYPCSTISSAANNGCGTGANGMLNVQNRLLGCYYNPCPSDDGYYVNVSSAVFYGSNTGNLIRALFISFKGKVTLVLMFLYQQALRITLFLILMLLSRIKSLPAKVLSLI